jgi:hypothetical protein
MDAKLLPDHERRFEYHWYVWHCNFSHRTKDKFEASQAAEGAKGTDKGLKPSRDGMTLYLDYSKLQSR